MYVMNTLSVYRRQKLEPSDFESIVIDLKGVNGSRFLIIVCYRSPNKNKPVDFLPSLYSAAENLLNTRNELLIIGDLNFDMLDGGSSVPDNHLSEFCDRFCLSNTIKEPTCFTRSSYSLIDVILASNPERFATSGTLKLGLSDFHDLIYTVRKQKLPRLHPRLLEYRSMINFDEEKLFF